MTNQGGRKRAGSIIYGKTIPNTLELSEFSYCPGLLHEMKNPSLMSPDHHILRRAIDKLLSSDISKKATRRTIKNFIKCQSTGDRSEKISAQLDSIANTIINIRKETGSLSMGVVTPIVEGPVSLNSLVDLVYPKAYGPCYCVILESLADCREIPEEHITSNIQVAGAVLTENHINRDMRRYVECIIPVSNSSDVCDRLLITIDSKSKGYIDFCRKSVYNTARKYFVEEEYLPNWTPKCNRCTQEGRCSWLRHRRSVLRGITQQL